MVANYILRYLLFIILLSSCAQKGLPDYVSDKFTYCFDGKDTGIESLININGYYVIAQPFSNFGYNSSDTSYFNLMFYSNGVCIINFFPSDGRQIVDNKYIPQYFKKIIDNPEFALGFYKYERWGRYIVEGDTIKAQCIYRPRKGETTKIWGVNEIWYKIINDTTIIEIPSIQLENTKTKHLSDYKKRKYLPAQFVPLSERPTPDCWLIKEDWFWCK